MTPRGTSGHVRERAVLDTVTALETPEHVQFRVRVAGPSQRSLAYVIDKLLQALVFLVVAVLFVATTGLGDDDLAGLTSSTGALFVVLFMLEWGYFVLFESLWNGQTPGKRWLGLRAIKEGGYPITFIDVALRNLVRAADFLPYGYLAGLATMSTDAKFRRIGDLVAGTVVVAERRTAFGRNIDVSPRPRDQELAAIPATPVLDGTDLDAIESFLRRERELDHARATELAQMVAPIYAKRLGIDDRWRPDPARFLALLYIRATQDLGDRR